MSDSLRMQLLVDGQLDHEVRREWLNSMDRDSKQWREIALRFVESQIFDEALRTPGSSPPKRPNISMPSGAQSRGPQSRISGYWLLATAASLLVGLVLGTLMPDQAGPTDIVSVAAVDSQSELQTQPIEPADEEAEMLNLPLADALARSATPVSINARRAFLKAGYFVDESQQIANVELPTGKSIQMPIRQVTVRYLGQNAYQ